MSALDGWLSVATRRLASDSAVVVRQEIVEHYESAREAAMAGGSSTGAAERIAIDALGDAKTANCQYRQVLLTSTEARLLRNGKREARAICSRPWLKWLMVAVPVALVEAAAVFFFCGRPEVVRDLVLAGIVMSPWVAMLLLPINTPLRGRIFRYAKWVAIPLALVLFYGPNALKWSWLLIVTLGPMAATEWTRASIRRKLPVSAWPRHLYL